MRSRRANIHTYVLTCTKAYGIGTPFVFDLPEWTQPGTKKVDRRESERRSRLARAARGGRPRASRGVVVARAAVCHGSSNVYVTVFSLAYMRHACGDIVCDERKLNSYPPIRRRTKERKDQQR